MKTSRGVLELTLVVMVGSLACGGKAAPTEPSRDFLSIGKVSIPAPAAGLSGVWSGTITFLRFENVEGDTIETLCPGNLSIQSILTENADTLSGQFQTCVGALEIHGEVFSNRISGWLGRSGGQRLGKISGTVSPSEIAFQTITSVEDDDDPGRDNDGDGTYVSSEVRLTRQEFAERTPPRPILPGRNPRVLGPRP